MRKISMLMVCWMVALFLSAANETVATYAVTAGNLTNVLTAYEKSNLTSLTLSGTIDARDFKTMRDDMPLLETLDLSGATILAYEGTDGTNDNVQYVYGADMTPFRAFLTPNGNNVLKTILLPSGLKIVGRSSFNRCSALSNVVFPNTLTTIERLGFYGCSNLGEVSLPNSLTTLGYGAFMFSGIFHANLPEGLRSMDEYAFQSCGNLEQVSLPSTLQRIGYCSFTFNDQLKSFTVAEANTLFKSLDGVLYDKSGKVLVTYPNKKSNSFFVPEGVEVIDTAAFEGCWAIDRVYLPTSLKRICLEAFYGCSSLEALELPSGLTSIENYAFSGCYNLTRLRVGFSNPIDLSFMNEVFENVDLYRCMLRVPAGSKVNFQQAAVWNRFPNMAEDVAKTVSISAGGLYNALTMDERYTVTHLKINGTIDARDFKTMRESLPLIAEIDLSGASIVAYTGTEGTMSYSTSYPANAIPQDAFFFRDREAPSRWMSRFVFPSTLKEVGDAAFTNSAVSDLTLNEGLTMLKSYALYGCRFTSIRIPASLKFVGEWCFSMNSCLKTFTVDAANTAFTLRDGMLYDKAGETLMGFPNALSKDVVVPEGTKTIKRGVFEGCGFVEYLHFPTTLTSIEMPAFDWMGSLRLFDMPSSNDVFASQDGVLFSKDKSILIAFPNQKGQHYQIPEGVTEIGPSAFAGNWNLNEVTLPSTLTKISKAAFSYAEYMNRISIPGSVNTIESGAFNNCFRLKYITANWFSPPSLNNAPNVFAGIDKETCVLRVPAGCANNYRMMSQWNEFLMIDEIQQMTYRVVVPNGTKACYLAGEMTGWNQLPMQKENSNVYRIDIQAHSSDEYKYYSGPGRFYEELDGVGNTIDNRNYNPRDTVRQWRNVYQPWMPYSPWKVATSDAELYGKVQMLTPSIGWISSGNDNSLFQTTNGGESWQKFVPFPNDHTVGFSEMPTSMDWKGVSNGWVLKSKLSEDENNLNGAVIYRTTNAGLNWSRFAMPQAFQPKTYQLSDLQGNWQIHQFVFSPGAFDSNNFTAWSRTQMGVDANGLLTLSDQVMSSGQGSSSETMYMNLSTDGRLSMPNQNLQGYLGQDKQTGAFIVKEESGSIQFGFMQKIQAGLSYQQSDLAGTWSMYTLNLDNPSDQISTSSRWLRYVLTIDATGNGTAQMTDYEGKTSTNGFQIQISAQGIVSIPGTDWHGFLNTTKNEMYATMTDDDGKRFDLCMLQKQNPSVAYKTSDLAGVWQMHEYAVNNTPYYTGNEAHAGMISLRSDGSGDVYESGFFEDGESDGHLNMAISTGGLITEKSGTMFFHGFMGENKNRIQYVRYEGGMSAMGYLQKDSTFTGEMGLQIQFVDETHGWVSIYNSMTSTIQMFRTTDGCYSWQPSAQSPSGIFHFLDADNGWSTSGFFTGTDSTASTWSIQHTTDGGLHWKAQYEYQGTNDDALSAIQFTDATHGWVIGDHCRILKSTDAGEQWMQYTISGLTANDRLSALFFLDANTGWIAVDGEHSLFILQTLDGGASWTTLNTNLEEGSINSLFFTDANHGWFTGRTDNQGFIGVLDNGTSRLMPLVSKSDWQIYPNPVSTSFTLSSAEPTAQATLFDLQGACVLRFTAESGVPVDVSYLKKGVYLLRIKTQKGIVLRKVVKM